MGGSLLGANFPRGVRRSFAATVSASDGLTVSPLATRRARCCEQPRGIKLSQSGRKLVCDKEVTIEAEEELPLRAEFGEFSKPGVCLFLGHTFASDREGRHDTQRAIPEGILVVFGIKHSRCRIAKPASRSCRDKVRGSPACTKCSFQADNTRPMRTSSAV